MSHDKYARGLMLSELEQVIVYDAIVLALENGNDHFWNLPEEPIYKQTAEMLKHHLEGKMIRAGYLDRILERRMKIAD